jgi:hypothetical protein
MKGCKNLAEMCVESDVRAAAAERRKWNTALVGGLAFGMGVAASFFSGGLTLLAAVAGTAFLGGSVYQASQQRGWRHAQLELERVGKQLLSEIPGYRNVAPGGANATSSSSNSGASSAPGAANAVPVRSLRTALGVEGDNVTRLQTPPRSAADRRKFGGPSAEVVSLHKGGSTSEGVRSPR